MNQSVKYECHCYVCPPKDGMIKYAFEYSNPRNGRMVAYLKAFVYESEIHLDELFVMPYARRHHLAANLIEQAIALRTNHTIHLKCYADNDPALALYKKLGFKINGESKDLCGYTLYHMIKK